MEINAQRSVDQPTRTPNDSLDLTVGGNFGDGRGNVVVSVNYMDRDGFTRGERGGWALPSLGDGCVTAASWSSTRPGTPLAVPAGQTCASAGGRPGLIFSGSSNVPTGRIGNLPVVGSAASNPALNAALIAAGLQNMSTLGAIFDPTGKTVRPYAAPGDAYDLGPLSYMVTPQKRWMSNAFAHYDFSERATGYMEAHFSSNSASVQIGPTSASGNFLFNTNNPYLSPQMQEVLRQLDLRETGTTRVTNGTSSLTTTPGDGLAVLNYNRRFSDLGGRVADRPPGLPHRAGPARQPAGRVGPLAARPEIRRLLHQGAHDGDAGPGGLHLAEPLPERDPGAERRRARAESVRPEPDGGVGRCDLRGVESKIRAEQNVLAGNVAGR